MSKSYVYTAKKVQERAPEAFDLMRQGRVTVPEAAELANLPDEVRGPAIEEARTQPERKVTSIVRAAKRGVVSKDQAVANAVVAAALELEGDEELRRKQLEIDAVDYIMKMGALLEEFDPKTYVPAMALHSHAALAQCVLNMRIWIRTAEAEMQHPMRLVRNGGVDAIVG